MDESHTNILNTFWSHLLLTRSLQFFVHIFPLFLFSVVVVVYVICSLDLSTLCFACYNFFPSAYWRLHFLVNISGGFIRVHFTAPFFLSMRRIYIHIYIYEIVCVWKLFGKTFKIFSKIVFLLFSSTYIVQSVLMKLLLLLIFSYLPCIDVSYSLRGLHTTSLFSCVFVFSDSV